jgi:ResB-like family
MTITFQVDQYMPSAIEKHIYEPVVLPKGQMGNGIAACRAEMTVDGQTKEIWLSRSENLDPPPPRTVAFRNSVYQLAYDVDRKPLGFEIKLDDFDTGFEPGTEQATHFESKVRLTDRSDGIKDQPHLISMNHPLDHRGYTFYQSNYIRMRDPETRQLTGEFQSVFQVASNPGRPIIYAGCILVVFGTFLQFYMRAGIFTDGGKRERERAAAKARKRLEAKSRSSDFEP